MMEAASTSISSKLLKTYEFEHFLSYHFYLRLGIDLGREVRGGGGRDGDQAYGEHHNFLLENVIECDMLITLATSFFFLFDFQVLDLT